MAISHQDHCKAAKDVMAAGIDIYCSSGAADFLGLQGHRLHRVSAKRQFSVGPWTIVPFDVRHDAEEPLGYLIANGDEKLLFATDTFYLKYKFRRLNYIMIECNYAHDTLDKNIESGYVDEARKAAWFAAI
jgi:phosphoribosyl 1,2-cyclic phosphodiesterase